MIIRGIMASKRGGGEEIRMGSLFYDDHKIDSIYPPLGL